MTPPEQFNLAETICRQYDDSVYRLALQEVKFAGINTYTFGGLDYLSDKFAMILSQCGIKPGDIIATVLPQGAAYAVSHLGILKAGAIVLPLRINMEQSELGNRLAWSGAKVIVADMEVHQLFAQMVPRSMYVEQVFVACDYTSRNDFGEGLRSFWYEVNFADSDFTIAETEKTTPAYLFYEENDGQLDIIYFSHGEIAAASANFVPSTNNQNAIFWTANDWASKRVLSERLYPAWYLGYAVASYEARGKSVEESMNDLKERGLEIIPL
jgi:acyl-coenzyme A synthetase/AMP-(fatty) acid ligase